MSAQPSESWDDPASLIALKATGCDCRKHGYKHIHDLCIADAAKVRPAIVPLVEALQRGIDFAASIRGIFSHPNFTDRYDDAGYCERTIRDLARALDPEEAQ